MMLTITSRRESAAEEKKRVHAELPALFKKSPSRSLLTTKESLPMKIRDSVALVTDANRGLDLAFAEEPLAAGARKIYAATRRPERIADDPRVDRVHLDVTKPDTITRIAHTCRDVNLLINNAGICYWSRFLALHAVEAARSEMETNYFGLVRLSRAFAPVLAKNGGGAIVNILSVLSWVSVPDGGCTALPKRLRGLEIHYAAEAWQREEGSIGRIASPLVRNN
jgi:NAD(P)-dependent dehydrogenase (short-subunit alcohol dehydrogenase family)